MREHRMMIILHVVRHNAHIRTLRTLAFPWTDSHIPYKLFPPFVFSALYSFSSFIPPFGFLWFAVLIQRLFLRLIYNRVVRLVTLFGRNLLFYDRIQNSTTNEGFSQDEIKKWYVHLMTHHLSPFTLSTRKLLQPRWWQEWWQTPSIAYYPAFLVYYPISAWINASFLVC